MPPPMTSTITLNPYLDPMFFEQLVKVVVAGMVVGASNSTPRAERVITLIQWVKDMQEMGCTTYSGEEDTERALVEEGGKGYRSDAGVRGNPGRLCDPVVNGQCPLLVGDHQRKKGR